MESKGFYLDRVRLYWRNARKGRYSNASRRVAFGGREHERILTRQTFSEVKRLTVETTPGMSLYSRFKFVVVQYGKVAVLFHASGLVTSIGISYTVITYGMGGIEPVMVLLPDWLRSQVPDGAGTLAVAFLLAECTAPPRYALTVVVAPLIGERLRGSWLGDALGLNRFNSAVTKVATMRLPYLPGRGLYAKGLEAVAAGRAVALSSRAVA